MVGLLSLAMWAGAAGAPEQAKVPFPHPLITEVLYAVPKGKEGDADGDGNRSSNGDEFVELVNPHDKPINLKGYVIMDAKGAKKGTGADDKKSDDKKDAKKDAKDKAEDTVKGKTDKAKDEKSKDDKGKDEKDAKSPKKNIEEEAEKHEGSRSRIRFEFPDLTLKPGEVVVVFNGHESNPPGSVGDSATAPKKNDKFGGAYVLSMKCTAKFQAFANDGDAVVLADPKGAHVETVYWGDQKVDSDITSPLMEKVPVTDAASVQRSGVNGDFVVHKEMKGAALFSPGRFAGSDSEAPKPAPKADKPADKSKDKPADEPKKKEDPKPKKGGG